MSKFIISFTQTRPLTLTEIQKCNPTEKDGMCTMQIGAHTIYMTSSDDCRVGSVKHLPIAKAVKYASLLRDEDILKANGFNVVRVCDTAGYARCLELFVPGLLLNKKEQEIRLLLPERHTHINNNETITIC
jgi:hypothetical protein